MSKSKHQECSDGYWPSHTPFRDLISHCVCGDTHPDLKKSWGGDHVAELCMLMHGDIDDFLWRKSASNDGLTMRRLLDKLAERVQTERDIAAAKMIYAIATDAAFEVMDIYLRNREIFDQITPRRNLLPCLHSIHPNTAKVTAMMKRDARLGTQTWQSGVIGSKAWFTSDAPANVYARAIITTIELNQGLEPVEAQQEGWASFDREHRVKTTVLPFPRYIAGIDEIPAPISPENVPQYWRKGKEIMLEEMPHFHRRPEWKNYHQRSYKDGAKPGIIQHAIFKDILAALRTIAGANKGRNRKEPQKPAKAGK